MTSRPPPPLSAQALALRTQRVKADAEYYSSLDYDRSRYTEDIATAARVFLCAIRNALCVEPADVDALSSDTTPTEERAASEWRNSTAAPGAAAPAAPSAGSRGTKRPASSTRAAATNQKAKKPKRAQAASETAAASDSSNGNGAAKNGSTGGNASIPPQSEVACRVKENGTATWILAKVRRYVSEQKKYEVTDSGEDEELKTHMVFKKHIRVVPKKAPDFEIGKRVLAVYPDTTTYYAAVVKSRRSNSYVLVFDDEDEEEENLAKEVDARHVFAL